jgi:hypothetical protein
MRVEYDRKQIFDITVRGWRKLHNEELQNLSSSPSIIRIIKSRRMGWWDMWHEWERRGKFVGYW